MVGSEQLLAVATDAIVKSEGKEYIFIVNEEHEEITEKKEKSNDKNNVEAEVKIAFKMIEVVTGVSELGYIQITAIDKIPDDARVVTKGAFYILSKAKGGSEEE
jgi:cobalt-zinc-cadmium efflux system membrane fusion protein